MNDPLLDCSTLRSALAERVRLSGSGTWLTLYAKERVACTLSYEELLAGACAFAAALERRGVGPRDSVLLVLPTERAFYEAYWGVLLLGAVPVPAYPPLRLGRLEEYLQQLVAIARNSRAPALVTNGLIAPLIRPAVEQAGLRVLRPEDVGKSADLPSQEPAPSDLGLLQYTSGSTGSPKGVMLSHANLLANLRAIGGGIRIGPEDVAFSWLPLYHDMGLIGLMLGTLYWGVPLIALSPIDFLRRPVRWIQGLSRHRVTLTAGPNFAYGLVARKVRDADLDGVDLSALRVALCGAEPIYPATIESFTRRYERHGLRPEAFFPAYGLAENTLAVTFSELGKPPRVTALDPGALEERGRAVPPAPGREARPVVSVGLPLPTVEVQIWSDDDHALPEGVRGQVVVRGPSVMSGYFDNPQATASALRGGWLHTGDLGFMLDGRLYVCGRVKDLIIKAGRNYFAEDLEAAAARVEGVRPGGLCAFGTANLARGTDEVVLLAEVAEGTSTEVIADELRKVVGEATGCRPDRVVPLPPHTLPKTSSGKIQRFRARQWYEDGSLESRGGERTTSGLWVYAKAKLKSLFGLTKTR